MPRCLLNFDHRVDGYAIHFVSDDFRSSLGPRLRFYRVADTARLSAFILRCNPEDMTCFGLHVRAWGRGSFLVNLSEVQYAKVQSDCR